MAEAGEANRAWGEMLAGWAIPRELVDSAPAPPYFFDPQVFTDAAREAVDRPEDTPSDEVAREALPPGGAVLDVGCGAGAASLRLRPDRLVGVDPSPPLLEALRRAALRLGVAATALEGMWPEAAPSAPVVDVVVCHHVFYNVADLAPFAAALDAHARTRVVVELTAEHPMAWMAPYWEALHGLAQPDRPTADDAVAVLAELGIGASRRRWRRAFQMIGEEGERRLERIARRLCLPSDRHAELREVLAAHPPPVEREVVTLWWDPGRGA
ncbi:MAG TPA: class I SAM-dependent methyltransferase [Acidimicrobiales bacterium]|nr:class I SAM-dependent methyltransferase [Acidimicrobiales bacterium]